MSEVKPFIEVYAFDECPDNWRELSTNGGDEDYIVVGSQEDWRVEDMAEKLAVCGYQTVILPDGRAAYITCHS